MIAPWKCWRNKSLLKRWFFAIQTIYLLVFGLPEFVSSTIPGSRRLCLMVGLLDFQGSNSHTLEVGTPPFQKKVSTVNLLLDHDQLLQQKMLKLGSRDLKSKVVGDLQLWRSRSRSRPSNHLVLLTKNASKDTRFNCFNHPKTKIISISWDEKVYLP